MTTALFKKKSSQLIKLTALALVVSFLTTAHAAVDLPGLIRLKGEQTIPTDLVDPKTGQELKPSEITEMINAGKSIDDLNPEEKDTWVNKKGSLDPKLDDLGIDFSTTTVNYESDVKSRLGNFRFSVKNGDKFYTILMSKKVHNNLLRKGLLRKIGYIIPAMQHVPKMRIVFKGEATKQDFLTKIKKNTFGDKERWVLDEKTENEVVIQDVIATASYDEIYNLGLGALTSEVIQNRRLYNSLLVAYNMTDVPESMNLFSWRSVRLLNESLYFPYEMVEPFSTSLSDAKWIAKRIAALNRQDIKEIVDQAEYPPEVALLAVEKLIARKMYMHKALSLNSPCTECNDFNEKISSGTRLVDGKLIGEEMVDGKKLSEAYPDYGSRFIYGDPASPINGPELAALFKSKLTSNLISNFIDLTVNAKIKTDISSKVAQHQQDLYNQQVSKFFETGKLEKVPFRAYTIPTFSGNLIMSRDVVAGSFLGTDNNVQIADTFGFGVNGGVFLGFDGLKAGQTLFGQLGLFYNRTFTHVRPVKSIKEGLKEPMKNMIVPYYKGQLSKILDKIVNMAQKYSDPYDTEMTEEQRNAIFAERDTLISEALTEFNKNLDKGESLLIQDSFGPSLGFTFDYPVSGAVDLLLKAQAQQVTLNRIHIYKKDDKNIQIYIDDGSYKSGAISLGNRASGFQILGLNFTGKKGEAKTKFYKLSTAYNKDLKKDSDEYKEQYGKLVQNLTSLKMILDNGSTEALSAFIDNPLELKHYFKEKSVGIDFLFLRWKRGHSQDFITMKTPEKKYKSFIYMNESDRSGKDFQSFVSNIVEFGLNKQFDRTDLSVNNAGGDNPGDTLYGSSYTRSISLHAEVPDFQHGPLKETFAEITYRNKGWDIKREAAEILLQKLNQRFNVALTWPQALDQVKSIQLYNIEMTLNIYQAAFDYLASVSPGVIEQLIQKHGQMPAQNFGERSEEDFKRSFEQMTMHSFKKFQKGYQELQNPKNPKMNVQVAAKMGLKMVTLLESVLPGEQLIQALGGKKNIYLAGRIQGFRDGSEAADEPILLDAEGLIGSKKLAGPIRYTTSNLDMSESEFLIYWLLNKI